MNTKLKLSFPRTAAAILVSAGLLALLLSRLELGPALARFQSADPLWLGLAAVFSLSVLLCRALRFASLTEAAALEVTTAAIAIQVFLNRVTPFRLGELSLPLLLKRHGAESFSGSLVSLVFVRILDLALVVWAVALSLAVTPERNSLPALIGASLLLAILLGTFRRWLGALIRLSRLVTRRLGGRLARIDHAMEKLAEASSEARRLNGRAYAMVTLTSLGIFVGQSALFGSILMAYGIQLPLLHLARGAAVALAGAAVPVAAVGTIGTQEASWVAGFVWVGVPLEEAIVTGIAAQLITLFFSAILALPAWLYLSRRAPGLEGS